MYSVLGGVHGQIKVYCLYVVVWCLGGVHELVRRCELGICRAMLGYS